MRNLAFAAYLFVCGLVSPIFAQTPVKISVEAGARQTFAGLGASCGNWGREYQKLSPAERAQLSQMLWRDLGMTSLRLWVNLNEVAPTRGELKTDDFIARYFASQIVADAQKNGVTELLFAPDAMPDWMKTKREGGPQDFALKTENITDYAQLIADFLAQIRRETGVTIQTTGVQNEPNDLDRIAPEQFPALIKALRAALDARGLKSVKIIAPESANVDGVLYQTLDILQKDAAAWAAIDGLASHSYSMAADENVARRLENTEKSYWMTEASANGAESPGDALQAASLASRFLSDMNHRVTHWIHFLGFEVPDPNDNATRILAFEPNPLRITKFQKYDYYRQLTQTFAVGAKFRRSLSDLEGEMVSTYGPKPRLTVAVAQNGDKSWGIGISNFTAPQFVEKPDNNGYANGFRAQTFDVTVEISELAKVENLPFEMTRSDGKSEHLTMRNGVLLVPNVAPLQLATLRSKIAR